MWDLGFPRLQYICWCVVLITMRLLREGDDYILGWVASWQNTHNALTKKKGGNKRERERSLWFIYSIRLGRLANSSPMGNLPVITYCNSWAKVRQHVERRIVSKIVHYLFLFNLASSNKKEGWEKLLPLVKKEKNKITLRD